jgi:hypothetical protein
LIKFYITHREENDIDELQNSNAQINNIINNDNNNNNDEYETDKLIEKN